LIRRTPPSKPSNPVRVLSAWPKKWKLIHFGFIHSIATNKL
jgi:hypothetical protein